MNGVNWLLAITAPRGSSNAADVLSRISMPSGWSEMASARVVAKGDKGLMNLYNGGYEVYTKAGVLEAAQGIWSKGSTYVTLTVHLMQRPGQGAAFVNYWKKLAMKDKPKATKAPGVGFTAGGNGAVNAWWADGRWFVTINVMPIDRNAESLANQVLDAVRKALK